MSWEKIKQEADANNSTGHYSFGGAWNPFNNMMGDLKRILHDTHPDEVDRAGQAYTHVSSAMDTTKDLIYKSAKTLADNWEGDACEKALQGMQKLWESADQIYSTSNKTGTALTGQAATLRKYRAQVGEEGGSVNSKLLGLTGAATILIPGMAAPVSFAAANNIYNNHDAQGIMQNLNNDTVGHNNQFPDQIRTDTPGTSQQDWSAPDSPGAPSAPTGPGAGGGGGGIPHGAKPTVPHGLNPNSHISTGQDPNAHYPGTGSDIPTGSGVGGSGTSLAGFDPTGGGGGLGGGGLGGAGLGGDPLGAGAGAGGGLGGANGLGAGLGTGLGAGRGLGPGGLGTGTGAGAAGAAGRGMMPMAGGHGQGEKERERSTWLTEDEDVWGNDGDVAPPMIG